MSRILSKSGRITVAHLTLTLIVVFSGRLIEGDDGAVYAGDFPAWVLSAHSLATLSVSLPFAWIGLMLTAGVPSETNVVLGVLSWAANSVFIGYWFGCDKTDEATGPLD